MEEPTPCDIQISPTIEAIKVIAENIRNYMEVVYGEDLAGHCIEASEKIVEAVFTELGIEAKTVEGWCRFDNECYGSDHPWDPHTWVEFPSLKLYVDVTADQFNYGMSPENEFPKIIVQERVPYGMVYSEPTWQDFTREPEFDVPSQLSDRIQASSTYTAPSKSASHLRAVKIMWDVDYGADGELLPTEIDIPTGMEDVEEISDYLSDLTGFCHEGFQLVEIEKNSIDFLIQSAENRATNSQSIVHIETKEPMPSN